MNSSPRARSRRSAPWIFAAALIAAALFIAAKHFTAGVLDNYQFPSGWLLIAVLGLLTLRWWQRSASPRELRERILTHLVFGELLLAVFGLHVNFRMPNGAIELALCVLLALLLISTVAGLVLVNANNSDDSEEFSPAVRQWLYAHVSLGSSLVALGMLHGVFAHAHGALAWVMQAKLNL